MNVKNSTSTWSHGGGNTIGGGSTARGSTDYEATTKPPINPSLLSTVPGDSDTFAESEPEAPVNLSGTSTS